MWKEIWKERERQRERERERGRGRKRDYKQKWDLLVTSVEVNLRNTLISEGNKGNLWKIIIG
jgi:hypothetical protein